MVTKSKKVQKTVYIDEDVWEALEKQRKMFLFWIDVVYLFGTRC